MIPYDDCFGEGPSLVQSLDQDRVFDALESSRPSREELDSMQDARLDLADPSRGIDRKKNPESHYIRLRKLITLTAVVLKNTEETTKPQLKSSAYNKILDCALAYVVLHRFGIIIYLQNNEDDLNKEVRDFLNFMTNYMPVIHQLSLWESIGTKKLDKVFRDEIKRVIPDDNISDLYKFFAVFLYAENRGDGYINHIKHLIDSVSRYYIEDATFLKLITYYMIRSKGPKLDKKLLNLIGDLIVKSKGLHPSEKGRIIAKHKQKKLKKGLQPGDKSQLTLDI